MIFYIVACLSFSFSFSQNFDWTKVQQTVDKYWENGAYPGAVLRISNGSNTLYTYEVGHLTHDSAIPFTQQTVFDIASLTKVSATLSLIIKLYDQKKIDIKDYVYQYIPEFNNNGKDKITLQNLLLHNAGLAPDHPDPQHSTKEEIMKWTYNCKLTYDIGTKMVYSDLSFILLGQIVQRVSNRKLQSYAKQWFQSMGLYDSTFLPPVSNLYNIAPTQYSSFRKKLIRGNVHDPTAYSFGGVAGHAGYFSTARDLQKYIQIHLNKGKLQNQTTVYNSQTIEKFYTRVDGLPYQNRRALGWDTVPIQDNPPCGHLFSLNSFGHTGYTGTMMWADRDKNLIVVFLTNRVHPSSLNTLISEARATIVDEIVKAYLKQIDPNALLTQHLI